MLNKTVCVFLLTSLLLYNCRNSDKEGATSKNEIAKPTEKDLAEGFQLIENNCFSCHSPNASMESRVAPPMEAVKKHYITNNTTQEQFTKDLIAFLNNPNVENSKMPGAINRFDLMPKMNFSEGQISKIASYIYNSELEKPEWFEKHYQKERQRYGGASMASPMIAGQQIAMKTKGVLGKNLLEAINTSGTDNALTFCSTRAIPLTDSMSVTLNAKIKRVSDKNRNPNNSANAVELAYIEAAKWAISKNEEPKPQLTTIGKKQTGYYPITTDKMCLQCHGKSQTDVLPNTVAKIRKLYPHDKALEYSVGDLRGIWVVEMENN